jgi:16S rRNA (cytosine967-C5)-methyltransferase
MEGTDARRAAVALLRGVLERHRPLSDQIEDAAGPLAGLAPAERARAQRLAMGALRRVGQSAAVLCPLMQRPAGPAPMAALRIALAEIAERPGDAHGIVNAAVEIARKMPGGGAAQAGFVNAILREVLRRGGNESAAAALQPLPAWIRRALVATFGPGPVSATEAVHAIDAVPLDLTLRDPGTAEFWAERLGAEILPTGSLRLARAGQVSALPGHAEGAWWVQDAAAALPARILAPAAQERIADLCAAPGGKTMQLAAAGAAVTAVDSSPARMARLAENLARTGLGVETVVGDVRDWAGSRAGAFDAVLLDAPCTATGTIRRHPDLPFVRRPADLAALVALQAALVDSAVLLTRPGGRIVYATCSLLPAEGEAQVAAALARHRVLRLDAIAPPGGLPDSAADLPGALRIWPHHWAARGGIDGFFIARMVRIG